MSFRKNVTISGTHILGGKDVKKLKADLAKAFPSLSDDDRDALLPPKAAVAQLKLSTRAVAYALEGGNPLLFDPNGRGDKLLPTVYALALLPAMLPVLHTYSEVSPKVLGGADLFLQGLLLPEGGAPPDFLAGSARALAVPGNPVPFAVGVMAVSGAEAVREEMKGRGLTVLHSFGDLLWALGDEEPPNEGFTPARVFPLDGAASSGAAPAADAGVDADAAAEALQGAALGDSSGAAGAESPAADGAADPADDNGATAGAGAAAAVDMDALLEAAALGGLRSLKTSELPIMSSDFYSKHMQPLKPQGVFFDFKASKYKKLSKLLDRLEKDKVLTQKQIRKQDHISGVDRSHPAYVAWAGMPGGAPAGEAADDDGGANGGGGGATAASGCQGQGSTRVESLFKVPGSLRAVFGEGSDKESLYSEAQVAQALSDYAQANGLGAPGAATMKVDHLLCSTLFGKKEAPEVDSAVPSAGLRRRLLDKLLPWHRITRPGGEGGRPVEVLRRGGLKPITVTAERRRGHNVTAVARVEGFGFVAEELAGAFARGLKTASSVSRLPGKAESDSEILLQGELLKQVERYFVEVAGLERAHLELVNKAKK